MPVLLPSPDLFIDFASKTGICTLFKNFTPYPSDRLAPPLATNSFSILPLLLSLSHHLVRESLMHPFQVEMTYVYSPPPSYSVIPSCLGIVHPFTRLLWPISCHVRVCVLVLHEAVSHIKVAWLGSCHKWWEWDITTASWKPTHSSLLRGALIWLRFLLCRPPKERTLLQASIKPFLIMGWRGEEWACHCCLTTHGMLQ